MSLNRPARLNRVLLALIGLLLLAGGLVPVAARFRLLRLESPLVSGTAMPPTWVWYVVAAVAIVLGLLCLRWLAAQLAHRPKTHTWRFEDDPAHGRTELAASTAVEPFTEEIREYPGVHHARATLAGTRDNPALALVLTLNQDADPAATGEKVTTEAVPRLRQALDLDDLPVTMETRFTRATGPRAR